MKEIPLGRSGKVALVDDADYEWLSHWKWHCDTRGYPRRFDMRGDKPRVILMHRAICNAQAGECVDHIDGNVSNNSRANLRICSHSENMHNRKVLAKNNSSGYKGVRKKGNSWHAVIRVNGRAIYLGCFKTGEEAASCYNSAAIKYHGEFATLNNIDKVST